MLFLTVGSQVPFDRLIETVDRWLETVECEIVAQIGEGGYTPKNMQAHASLEPAEYKKLMGQSQFVIAHAGMGTIISSLMANKEIIVMPRKAILGEHRSDHQLGTVREMSKLEGVNVAVDERELLLTLEEKLKLSDTHNVEPLPKFASGSLLRSVSGFLKGNEP
ncbi:MAG: hypothetical protein HQL32_07345 [Planctomycetes bacterium]|nr:hypothetical protein [Planctomycetota bacterium]